MAHDRNLRLISKTNQLALGAVVITILLLFFSRLTTSWDLYTPIPPAQIGLQRKPDVKAPEAKICDSPSAAGSGPGPANSKAAAILETRPLDYLIPTILHFSSVLGPEWPIHVFTSSENMEEFKKSVAFNRQVNAGSIRLENLPEGTPKDFSSHKPYYYSQFLTHPWFWEKLAPADHVLLFQADSTICANSESSVDDFLEYDFIGAPVVTAKGKLQGLSGELSLRNRKMMLEIVLKANWEQERKGRKNPMNPNSTANITNEDRWFWMKMRTFNSLGGWGSKAKLPSMDVAGSFAVAKSWHDRPLGYHHAHVWADNQTEQILQWCPEYSMSMQATISQG